MALMVRLPANALRMRALTSSAWSCVKSSTSTCVTPANLRFALPRGQHMTSTESYCVAWVYQLKCEPGTKGLTMATWRTTDGEELFVNIEATRGTEDVYRGTFYIDGGTGRLEGARGYGTIETRNTRFGPVGIRRGVIWRE